MKISLSFTSPSLSPSLPSLPVYFPGVIVLTPFGYLLMEEYSQPCLKRHDLLRIKTIRILKETLEISNSSTINMKITIIYNKNK